MTFDPHKATTTELRNWLARADHLKHLGKPLSEMPWAEQEWDTNLLLRADTHGLHRHPPTLDAAAAALPDGMRAERRYCEVMSRWEWAVLEQNPDGDWCRLLSGIPDTGDPIHDLYLLAVLARRAQKEKAQ